MALGIFLCRNVLLIQILVGKWSALLAAGATVLAAGAGWVVQVVFLSSILSSFFFSLFLGDGWIWTEILSQRTVKPLTTKSMPFTITIKFNVCSINTENLLIFPHSVLVTEILITQIFIR